MTWVGGVALLEYKMNIVSKYCYKSDYAKRVVSALNPFSLLVFFEA